MNRPARVLFAMFQGGGNIPLIMPVVARLVARGHQVRVMAGPGVRHSRLPVSAAFLQRIGSAGATFVPFSNPDVHPMDQAPSARGLIGGWVPKAFWSVQRGAQARDRCYVGPHKLTSGGFLNQRRRPEDEHGGP